MVVNGGMVPGRRSPRWAPHVIEKESHVIQSPLLADLERALELLQQVDESRLDFDPDPTVSADIKTLTNIESYPTDSHQQNLEARIHAVATAGDRLEARNPSEYVSGLIVACVRLAPPSDD